MSELIINTLNYKYSDCEELYNSDTSDSFEIVDNDNKNSIKELLELLNNFEKNYFL